MKVCHICVESFSEIEIVQKRPELNDSKALQVDNVLGCHYVIGYLPLEQLLLVIVGLFARKWQ